MQLETTVYMTCENKIFAFRSDYQFCVKLRHENAYTQLNFESEKLFTTVSIPTVVLHMHMSIHILYPVLSNQSNTSYGYMLIGQGGAPDWREFFSSQ